MRANIYYRDINELQHEIMVFVDVWVRSQKTPVPKKQIMLEMRSKGVKDFTTMGAIHALIRKGYIRPAVSGVRSYVQLRRTTMPSQHISVKM